MDSNFKVSKCHPVPQVSNFQTGKQEEENTQGGEHTRWRAALPVLQPCTRLDGVDGINAAAVRPPPPAAGARR